MPPHRHSFADARDFQGISSVVEAHLLALAQVLQSVPSADSEMERWFENVEEKKVIYNIFDLLMI